MLNSDTLETCKVCFKCGESKPLSAFYKHFAMSDGHVNKCKECNKHDVRQNRKLKKLYYDAYDRVRGRTPKRRDAKKQALLNNPQLQERLKEYKKNYKYDKKRKDATTVVSSAVREGMIRKLPCLICGKLEVEGHHPDYDQPLDVIWLCTEHHAACHWITLLEEDIAIVEKFAAQYKRKKTQPCP